MGWKEYYALQNTRSFGEQIDNYKHGLKYINKQIPILTPDDNKTFVLGGFNPYVQSHAQFLQFASKMHPNPHDRHIFLDMNRPPLTLIDTKDFPYKVQANLQNLPLQPESLDFLFLDFTLLFMTDNQVTNLAASANSALKKNGIIMATAPFPLITWFYAIDNCLENYMFRTNKVHINNRPPERIMHLMNPLKPVLWIQKKCDLLIFSKPDSDLDRFTGDPIWRL